MLVEYGLIFPMNIYVFFYFYFRTAEQVSLDEYYYLFLKRLCQVLIELGKQLCAMWVSTKV